jgi:hypothetical protein
VEVSKDWLDLCIDGTAQRIAITAAAVAAWLDRVRKARAFAAFLRQ